MARGAWGEHRVQYCFSMLGCAWSSFISILSVSWYIGGVCGRDVSRIMGSFAMIVK